MQIDKVKYLVVEASQDGQRLDNYLLRCYRKVPKSRIYRAIRKGESRINKKRAKPSDRVTVGDQIRVPPLAFPNSAPPSIKLETKQAIKNAILFEDDELLVIHKPSGIAVHGGSGLSYGIIESLRQCYPSHQYLELIHRLDRDTSGVLLVAKKPKVLRECHRLLREGAVDKNYLLLVSGIWPKSLRNVNAPLKKNVLVSNERIVTVAEDGKPALTQFEVCEYFDGATLLKATLCTGRTHQIRVHTAHHRYPIIGDEKYGNSSNKRFRELGLKRLFLHAESVRFTLSEYPSYQFYAELPSDLSEVLSKLRKI